jgi:hypothetical protein
MVIMDKIYKYESSGIKDEGPKKKPIYRGCKNQMCFCTGKCREIIGYEEIIEKKFTPVEDAKRTYKK